MEQEPDHSTYVENNQTKSTYQVLIIDGYRVRVNYLSNKNDSGKNSILHRIHELLLSSYHTK
jgi:endo-1,4-beta-D-glucanase Y